MTGLSGVFSGSGHRPVATRTCSRTACARASQASRVGGRREEEVLVVERADGLPSRASSGFLPVRDARNRVAAAGEGGAQARRRASEEPRSFMAGFLGRADGGLRRQSKAGGGAASTARRSGAPASAAPWGERQLGRPIHCELTRSAPDYNPCLTQDVHLLSPFYPPRTPTVSAPQILRAFSRSDKLRPSRPRPRSVGRPLRRPPAHRRGAALTADAARRPAAQGAASPAASSCAATRGKVHFLDLWDWTRAR